MPNIEHKNTVIITKGITAWPSTYPYESRIEGHSAIYPHGGYYKLNLDGGDGKPNCLLTKTQYATSDFKENGGVGGCYLSVKAPTDYEITSSFPIPIQSSSQWSTSPYYYNAGGSDDGNDINNNEKGEEESTKEGDPFTWIPYNDNPWNYNSNTNTNNKAAADDSNNEIHAKGNNNGGNEAIFTLNNNNRGYQARTLQCFGYHTSSNIWYVWTPSTTTETVEPSRSSAATTIEDLQITLPNDNQYGYSNYLPIQSKYDNLLSIR